MNIRNMRSREREQAARWTRPAKLNVGGATLIMIFAVLCLTVFAALTLTTANAENATVTKYAETTSEYYAADALALELAEDMSDAYGSGADYAALSTMASEQGAELQEGADGSSYTLTVPMNDQGSVIRTVLRDQGGRLEIVSSTQEEDGDWDPDTHLNVIGG